MIAFCTALYASAPGRVHANDARCVAAFEATQQLRMEGKLRAARDEALVCAAAGCPALTTKDCSVWLEQLEAETPSIVLLVKSSSGADLIDVEVSIDGIERARRLAGRAWPIDPGVHHIRLSAAAHGSQEANVMIIAGEKNRKIVMTLTETPRSPDRPHPRSSSVLPLTLGGVALTAAVASTVFGLGGLSKKGELDDSRCKPACDGRDVDAMMRSFVIADVLGAVAIAAAAAGVIMYFGRTDARASTGAHRNGSFGLRF